MPSPSINREQAFALYLGMGNGRSQAKLARVIEAETGHCVAPGTIAGWSSEEGWIARIAQIERERTAQAVEKYIEEAPTVTAAALGALESTIKMTRRLVEAAALLDTLEIKTIKDLDQVNKVLISSAKLAEVLQGRPSDRTEARGSPAQPQNELAGISAALGKIAGQAGKPIPGPIQPQDIDSGVPLPHGSVIDAEYIEVKQGDKLDRPVIDVMTQSRDKRESDDQAGADLRDDQSAGPPPGPPPPARSEWQPGPQRVNAPPPGPAPT